jgi:hypothetical protein
VDTSQSRGRVVLEVYGALVVKASLDASGVVEALDVVEQRGVQGDHFGRGGSRLEGGEERFDGGVLVAAADGAERLVQLEVGQAG